MRLAVALVVDEHTPATLLPALVAGDVHFAVGGPVLPLVAAPLLLAVHLQRVHAAKGVLGTTLPGAALKLALGLGRGHLRTQSRRTRQSTEGSHG